MSACPTCNGTGQVAEHVARALRDQTAAPGGTCHCDGPPHTYAPGWCPASGPVTHNPH